MTIVVHTGGGPGGGGGVSFVHYEDVLTQTEADNGYWDISSQVVTIIEVSAMVTRNGQKMRKTAVNPPADVGEWYWDSATRRILFKSGYLEVGDEMSIWTLV